MIDKLKDLATKTDSYPVILRFFFAVALPLACAASGKTSDAVPFGLNAPELGITSSSIVLLWEDSYIQDYSNNDPNTEDRTYQVFENGKQIGETSKRSYPAYGLNHSSEYHFSISVKGQPKELLQLRVKTKRAEIVYNVKDFGAVGDGRTIDTLAIQATIDACSNGGKVLIPAGTYRTSQIRLKSDMIFEMDKDSRLDFLGYGEGDYPIEKTLLKEADSSMENSLRSLIAGYGVENVVITGEGIINGNGETWWPHAKTVMRPRLLLFINSSNILVQGLTMQDPPAWNNHLLYVDDALYSDVKFLKVSPAHGTNGDGLNPDSSRNLLVVGCLFANQDDSIAIKSGRGRTRQRSCEYITIRDCVFDGDAAPGASPLGIAIGSETTGGAKHILVKNCTFNNVNSLMYIKTNRERAFAVVEDVRVEGIKYVNNKSIRKQVIRGPISIDMYYYDDTPRHVAKLKTEETPIFRDIRFKNVYVYNSVGRGLNLCGLPESPLSDVSFEDVYIQSKLGVRIQNTHELEMEGLTILPIENPN